MRDSFQFFFKQSVGDFPHLVWEIMRAVGMLDAHIARRVVQLVDLIGGRDDAIDALPFEVAVLQRRADKDMARRQRGDQFVEIVGDFIQPPPVVGEARHVAELTPALFRMPDSLLAIVVIRVGVEPAAADDDLDAFIGAVGLFTGYGDTRKRRPTGVSDPGAARRGTGKRESKGAG